MKKERDQRFEMYNHCILWTAACKNLGLAHTSHNDEMFYSLGAMLLTYFAFEGYINWLGNLIAAEVWEKEKDFFGQSPYQGTLGKYRFLAKILVLAPPDPSQGAFQTAKNLQQLRHMAVHPKPESGTRPVDFADGHFPPTYRGRLADKVSLKKADRAQQHIDSLAKKLHGAAKKHYHHLVTTSEPFSGMLGFQITDA